MKKEILGALIGSSASAVGTAMQPDEVLQIISLVITIIGAIISMIIIPILTWWKNAKKDGKITKEEIQDAGKIIVDGVNSIKDTIEDKEEK